MPDHKIVYFVFGATLLTILIFFTLFGYLHKGWVFTIDGEGYYMMGRSLYFDHDFDYRNDILLTPHPELFDELIKSHGEEDKFILHFPWPIGYALLSQPFFFFSDILTSVSNSALGTSLPIDGYGGIYSFLVPCFWS